MDVGHGNVSTYDEAAHLLVAGSRAGVDDAGGVPGSGHEAGGRLGLQRVACSHGQDVLRLGRLHGLAVELLVEPTGQHRLLGDGFAVKWLLLDAFGFGGFLRPLWPGSEMCGYVAVRTALGLVLETRQILLGKHKGVQKIGILEFEVVLLGDGLVDGVLGVDEHGQTRLLLAFLVHLVPGSDLAYDELLILVELRPLVVEVLWEMRQVDASVGVIGDAGVVEFEIAGVLVHVVVGQGARRCCRSVGIGLDSGFGLDVGHTGGRMQRGAVIEIPRLQTPGT